MSVIDFYRDAPAMVLAIVALAALFLAAWRLRLASCPASIRIDAALPQTQCGQCGYNGCRPYAEAIASGRAAINRCPPGGSHTIRKLASLTGQMPMPLDPSCGNHKPRQLAVIDEARCIGCTLCIQACPVDAILGAPKLMHTVIAAHCTGCELCVPPCPVDCIDLVLAPKRPADFLPWKARLDADAARDRSVRRLRRLERDRLAQAARLAAKAESRAAAMAAELDPALERKRAIVAAALARARTKLAASR